MNQTSIPTPNLSDKFAMVARVPVRQIATVRDSIMGQFEESPLATAFFSSANVQIVQNGIRAGVYHRSNGRYTIGEQNDETLRFIMRNIFIQHAVNIPTNISAQISGLNRLVFAQCVDQVYSEAKGRMKYLYDVDKDKTPIGLPVLMSQKGGRQYTMPDWFGVHNNEDLRANRNKPRF